MGVDIAERRCNNQYMNQTPKAMYIRELEVGDTFVITIGGTEYKVIAKNREIALTAISYITGDFKARMVKPSLTRVYLIGE